MAGRTGAHALLDVLAAWGVEQVFCCPGSTEVPLLDALVDAGDIRFVLTTHESVAVAMADGYARHSGRPGVAYLHTNVGLGNGMAHLYAAHTARSPVVVLTGIKPTATLPHRALTTASDIRELARPYCKADWQTLRADALAGDLHRVLSAAVTAPAGPAFLAVPEDVLGAELTPAQAAPLPVPPTARSAPDPDDVVAAAAVLAAAERPLVVAGGEVARHGALPELAELARLLGAPVVAEPRRDIEATAVRTDDPHFVGLLDPASEVVAAADAILLAGCPTMLESEPGRFPELPGSAAVVHLSEDPRELGRRWPVRVGLCGDARLGLAALLAELKHRAGPGRGAHLERARAAYLASRPAPPRDAALTVPLLASVLAAAWRPGEVLVVDAVTATEHLLRAVPRNGPGSLHATATGSLGWGMGAALGVALADPQRPVTCVVGDGVFQFGVPALFTARAHDVAVRFVVVSNGSYAAVRNGLRRHGGRAAATGTYPLTSIAGVDAAAVARGYGIPAERVTTAAELRSWSATVGDGPALVDVVVADR